MQDDVAPEHDPAPARSHFALNLFEEVEIDAAFAFGGAELFALAKPEVPGFVAADVEVRAGKIREQFIVESAQERECARIIWRERGRATDEFAARIGVRRGN